MHLPGGHRVQEFLIGEEGIRSHQDIPYHSSTLTNHTNYQVHIPPGLLHRPTNRVIPHSFLLPQHTASTARAIPILPLPISLLQITLPQTRQTISTARTIRTSRRTHTRTITNLSNRPTLINACRTTPSLITSPTPWPTTPTTTNIIPTATICHSRSSSTAPPSANHSGFSLI